MKITDINSFQMPNHSDSDKNKSISSSLELGEAEIRIVKFAISLPNPITILPLHPTGLVSVPENSALKMFCLADGHPTPEVTWNKNFQQINLEKINSEQMKISSKTKGSSILSFKSIRYEDSGSYSCQAMNVHGQVQKAIRLKVTRISTIRTTTPSLCDQIPNYCVNGKCVSGLDSQNSFMCLCLSDFEGARCENPTIPKNRMKVKFQNPMFTTKTPCSYGCNLTGNHIFFYAVFGFLMLILGLFLAIFLLQRKRRLQLLNRANVETICSNKNREQINRDNSKRSSDKKAEKLRTIHKQNHNKSEYLVQQFTPENNKICQDCRIYRSSRTNPGVSHMIKCYSSYITDNPSLETLDDNIELLTDNNSSNKCPTSVINYTQQNICRTQEIRIHPCIYVDSPQFLPICTIESREYMDDQENSEN